MTVIVNNGDLAYQRAGEFRADLATINPSEFFGLPDLTAHVNHEAKLTRPNLDVPTGMYIESNVTSPVAVAGADFVIQPGNRLSRENSHNNVFFGRLALHGVMQRNIAEVQVAVKPVTTMKECLGELAMFQYIRSLGLPTFKPLAIGAPRSGRQYLITKFDRPILTMDTVEWRELGEQEMWSQVSAATDTLALLHSNMLFHGDAEFKNIAFDDTGSLVIVDPEFTQSAATLAQVLEGTSRYTHLTRDEAIVLAAITKRMSVDLTYVCKSVNTFVLPMRGSKMKPDVRLKMYKRQVFEPYKRALQRIRTPYLEILERAYDDMLADRKQQAAKGIL